MTVQWLFKKLIEDIRRGNQESVMRFHSFSGRKIQQLPTAEEIDAMDDQTLEEGFILFIHDAFRQRG